MDANILSKINKIQESNILVLKNTPLNHLSWIKAGGTADFIIKPDSVTQIKYVLDIFCSLEYLYPLGQCSNILFDDHNYQFPFISLDRMRNIKILHDEKSVYLESGCILNSVENHLNDNGFSLFPNLVGIPASVEALYI